MVKKYLRLFKEPLALLNDLPDLLLTIDQDLIVTHTNCMEDYESILGKNVLDLVPEESRAQYTMHLFAAFNGARQEFELPGYDDNFQKVWYNINMLGIRVGEAIESLLIISTNITERKRGEEKRKESEYMLSQAERIARIGSWEIILETGEKLW